MKICLKSYFYKSLLVRYYFQKMTPKYFIKLSKLYFNFSYTPTSTTVYLLILTLIFLAILTKFPL